MLPLKLGMKLRDRSQTMEESFLSRICLDNSSKLKFNSWGRTQQPMSTSIIIILTLVHRTRNKTIKRISRTMISPQQQVVYIIINMTFQWPIKHSLSLPIPSLRIVNQSPKGGPLRAALPTEFLWFLPDHKIQLSNFQQYVSWTTITMFIYNKLVLNKTESLLVGMP